jgi:hypothetical protein
MFESGIEIETVPLLQDILPVLIEEVKLTFNDEDELLAVMGKGFGFAFVDSNEHRPHVFVLEVVDEGKVKIGGIGFPCLLIVEVVPAADIQVVGRRRRFRGLLEELTDVDTEGLGDFLEGENRRSLVGTLDAGEIAFGQLSALGQALEGQSPTFAKRLDLVADSFAIHGCSPATGKILNDYFS